MIKNMVELGRSMSEMNIAETPNMKALLILSKEFRKHKLPTKYIGRIKLDVNENFFEDEMEAEEFIENMVSVIEKIYAIIQEEFGDEADFVFGDCLTKFKIEYVC